MNSGFEWFLNILSVKLCDSGETGEILLVCTIFRDFIRSNMDLCVVLMFVLISYGMYQTHPMIR